MEFRQLLEGRYVCLNIHSLLNKLLLFEIFLENLLNKEFFFLLFLKKNEKGLTTSDKLSKIGKSMFPLGSFCKVDV